MSTKKAQIVSNNNCIPFRFSIFVCPFSSAPSLLYFCAWVSHQGFSSPSKRLQSLLFAFWLFCLGTLVHSCNFDSGLCGWIKDKDDGLHWEPVRDASGKAHAYDLIL